MDEFTKQELLEKSLCRLEKVVGELSIFLQSYCKKDLLSLKKAQDFTTITTKDEDLKVRLRLKSIELVLSDVIENFILDAPFWEKLVWKRRFLLPHEVVKKSWLKRFFRLN